MKFLWPEFRQEAREHTRTCTRARVHMRAHTCT